MSTAVGIFSILAISAGAFFFLAGTVGLLRFPDTLTRLHALTKADNLGLGLVVLGLVPWAGGFFAAVKLICIWLLVQLAGAVGAQLIASLVRVGERKDMTAALAFDAVLVVLVLAVAAWTVVAREASAAVVGFIVYGLLLAFVWVRLSAVDIALTEAAVGSGMTGVLLLGIVARTRGTSERKPVNAALRSVAAILCALVAAALATLVLRVTDPAPSLGPMVAHNLPATGLGNPVTGVLMSFRAFDTFGEKVVLFVALIGVWSLTDDRGWSGAPVVLRLRRRKDLLVLLARVLVPVGIVVGIFLLWVGADHPGGAFQGGTIQAAMWLLAMMAGLSDPPRIDARGLRLVLVGGAALFLAVGLAGFATAGAFLGYPPAHAKTLIILIEAAMLVSIAATLALLVAGPPERGGQR